MRHGRTICAIAVSLVGMVGVPSADAASATWQCTPAIIQTFQQCWFPGVAPATTYAVGVYYTGSSPNMHLAALVSTVAPPPPPARLTNLYAEALGYSMSSLRVELVFLPIHTYYVGFENDDGTAHTLTGILWY